MQGFISTISTKGQVTLPVQVRKYLKVDTSDKISFVIEPNGKVQLTQARYPNVRSLIGVAGKLKKKMSFGQMRKIAYEERLKSKYGQ